MATGHPVSVTTPQLSLSPAYGDADPGAPEPQVSDVGSEAARIADLVEPHVERRQEAALLRHQVDEVGLRLVGDIVPLELFPDLQRFASALAPRAHVPIYSFETGRFPDFFNNAVPRTDGEWWSA